MVVPSVGLRCQSCTTRDLHPLVRKNVEILVYKAANCFLKNYKRACAKLKTTTWLGEFGNAGSKDFRDHCHWWDLIQCAFRASFPESGRRAMGQALRAIASQSCESRV